MELICINGFVKDSPCCKTQGESLFHGIKIIKNGRTICHEFPMKVRISDKQIIFIKDGFEKHYNMSEFSQSKSEIKDIIARCISGVYGNQLKQTFVKYTVDSGDQSIFLCPKLSTDTYLEIQYYDVYVNGQLCSEGTSELQYELDGGDINFTIPIEDTTPSDPNIVEIYYWLKY